MSPQELARLRKELRPVAESLPLEAGDPEVLRAFLGQLRGRPVELVPFPLDSQILGFWAATDTADYIFYEQNTSPYHQQHLLLHEASHMLLDHQGPSFSELVARMCRYLDPRLVESLLCHSTFDDRQEAEAEVLATLIEERLDRSTPPRLRRGSERSADGIARFYREVQ